MSSDSRRGKSFIGFSAALFVIAWSFFLPDARADDCGFARDLLALTKTAPTEKSGRAEWSRYGQERYTRANAAADLIFQVYRAGKWKKGSLTSCSLGDLEAKELSNAIPVRFFQLSLQALEKSGNPGIRSFVKDVRFRSEGENILPYRLVGHLPNETNPTDRPGGFHRGHQTIFMDFERIPPAEWLVIFTHELLHAMDTRLLDGMSVFGNPVARTEVQSLIDSKKTFAQLTLTEKQMLERWLIGGLDRGYLAEARAWAVTLHFYEELKAENTQKRISWLENISSERRVVSGKAESDFKTVLRYLDSRFTDPSEGWFASPLIREALTETRTRLRRGEIKTTLGDLSKYY